MRLAKLAVLGFLLAISQFHVQAQFVPAQSGQQPAATNSQPGKIVEYSLPPDKLEKAHALYLQSIRTEVVDSIYGFVILLAILYFGVAARFRNFAESKSQNKWLQGLIIFPLFIITLAVLTVPSDIYHHHLSRAYGLSVQGWGSWWADWAKTLLLGVALETILLLLLYWMIRISPKRWWFYGWLIGIPIVVFIVFIAPVLIEPLFFKFTPLDQS